MGAGRIVAFLMALVVRPLFYSFTIFAPVDLRRDYTTKKWARKKDGGECKKRKSWELDETITAFDSGDKRFL